MKYKFIIILLIVFLLCVVPVVAVNTSIKYYLTYNGTAGSTVFPDSSNSGNHYTVAIGKANLSTITPKFGSASLILNSVGTGDATRNISQDWNSGTGSWSVSFWMNETSPRQDYGTPFMLSTSGTYATDQIGLELRNNQNQIRIKMLGGDTDLTLYRVLDRQNYYVLTKSGNTISLYVNGTLVGTRTDATAITAPYLQVGGDGSYWFKGYIDEFKYYNGTVIDGTQIPTQEEMTSLAPVADFTASPVSLMVGNTSQFNDTSTNTPTMWNYSIKNNGAGTTEWWNGTTLAFQNLSWIPYTGGNFTIQLWAQNTGGGNYSSTQQFIDVWNWSPASFSGTPQMGANPLTVTFTGSSNNASTYYWKFGDTGTSAIQSPTHQYTSDGTFTVNYGTTNTHHAYNWSNQTGYIQVNVTLTADFFGAPTVGYANLPVNFVDMSTGDGLYDWAWDFGDTGTSALRNPTHTYTLPGSYNVKLTVKGSDGTAVTTKNSYVSVLYPFNKYSDPLGYILANGADNKIHFYDFKNATDGEYIEIIVSGSYEVP